MSIEQAPSSSTSSFQTRLAPLSRRQFLRTVAATGATVGVGGAVLAACGGSNPTTTPPVTLYISTKDGGTIQPMPTKDAISKDTSQATGTYAALLSDWFKKHPGVSIQPINVDNNDMTQMIPAIIAKKAPSIFPTGAIASGSSGLDNDPAIQTAWIHHLAADVTSLINQYKVADELTDYAQPLWPGMAVAGRYYGVPVAMGAGEGIYFRRDILQQRGIEEPKPDWSWEDFRSIAKQLTGGKQHGFAAPTSTIQDIIQSEQIDPLLVTLPAPDTGWHWQYDYTSWINQLKDRVNLYRTMLNEDKSILTDVNWGEFDTMAPFIREDVYMISGPYFFYTFAPHSDISISKVAEKLNKPEADVIGFVPKPQGSNGALPNGRGGAIGLNCFTPYLSSSGLGQLFDLWHYFYVGDGLVQLRVQQYNKTKDIQSVYDDSVPAFKVSLKFPGVPGTVEDAWGAGFIQQVRKLMKEPYNPVPGLYLPPEKNAGPTTKAHDDAMSTLARTNSDVAGVFSNLQSTQNQQLQGLSSSISKDDFVKGIKKYYQDLDAYWKQMIPDSVFYTQQFTPWYQNKVLPLLNA